MKTNVTNDLPAALRAEQRGLCSVHGCSTPAAGVFYGQHYCRECMTVEERRIERRIAFLNGTSAEV